MKGEFFDEENKKTYCIGYVMCHAFWYYLNGSGILPTSQLGKRIIFRKSLSARSLDVCISLL